MRQFKTVWLSLLFIGLFPLSAIAEGEGEPIEMLESDSDTRMLRQVTTVKGYQPLSVAGQDIEATYLEETLGERHGAIVFLHDQGEQFESYGVVTPLRHSLPAYGWSTLTLAFHYPFDANILLVDELEPKELEPTEDQSSEVQQEEKETAIDTENEIAETESNSLPIVSNQERIQAALALLQSKGVERIVFLGHGAGGDLAIELLDTIKTPISALVLVGATAMPKSDVFKEFNFPILDVYGANDLDNVPEAVAHRKVLMKRNDNTRYEVRRISGADHVFSGLTPTLTVTISSWLRKKFVEQADN